MRNRRIHFRITQEDYENIESHIKEFKGYANYFMSAAKEFSNNDNKRKQVLRTLLSEYLKKYNTELSHIGGNLNQAIHLFNSLNKAGILSPQSFESDLRDKLNEIHSIVLKLQKELNEIVISNIK